MQIQELAAILGQPAVGVTKLTLLLLYLRLFSQNTPVKWGIWIGMVACFAFYTCSMFILTFRLTESGVKTAYAVTVFGVVTDLYLICLPLSVVARLHLNRAKKWRVAGVFATGLLPVVMSILGCIFRFELEVLDYAHDMLPIYLVWYCLCASGVSPRSDRLLTAFAAW
ncbi:hypothetical protein ASPCAL03464 [Aspergillus calidoustus]|uniref:Rhodopsin domain-containing protein n=1 Tax=Aspergillus calidoustus TaxID=454130 RepID=A0A0U4YYJ3_ASPCI|nr:hypothetical protein ASPCAL03464 [Aspergillus calidoustus]